jgi:hypothetical protein
MVPFFFAKLLIYKKQLCIISIVKESGSMVNMTSKFLVEIPTWGGVI